MADRRQQYRDQVDAVSIELIQHTEPDERFYENPQNGKWYASVTTILDVLPKDPFLEEWKRVNGHEATDQVMQRQAKKGTTIHNIIDDLCIQIQQDGQVSLDWFDENGYKKWETDVWLAVTKFVDFYNEFVDYVILTEQKMFSDNLDVSGTVDALFMLKDGRTALVDHKFTSALSDKFSIQTYCYKEMILETFGIGVDVRGNLWLRSQKRGRDKTGKKMQGSGWEFVEHEEEDRDSLLYQCAHTIFKDKYRKKEIVPEHRTYPRILTIGKEKTI
jgi:hypothetical protein